MKPRATPLTIPDTRIYVELDVPGKGAHHFRLPRIGRAAELLELLPQDEIKETKAVLEGGSLRDQMRHYASVEDLAASFVAELWHHQTLELESPKGDAAALAEEFHEAGYSPSELYSICVSLLNPLRGLLFPVTEARDPDGFFDELRGGAETPQ